MKLLKNSRNIPRKLNSILSKFLSNISFFFEFILIRIKKPNILIYDLDSSPSTFGDFTYFIYCCSYFSQERDLEVYLRFSDEIYKNTKWEHLDEDSTLERINNILNYGIGLAERLSFKNFTIKVLKFDENTFLDNSYYLNYVTATKISKYIWHNFPFATSKNIDIPKFKPSKLPEKLVHKNFISIVTRFDHKKKGSFWYNSSNDLVSSMINLIQEQIGLPVFIVSDKAGCDAVKTFISKNNEIYFSSDFGTYLTSIDILLSSRGIFQKDAGGICVPFLLSDSKYFVSMWPGNLSIFNSIGLNNSSRKDQIFFSRMEDDEFLEHSKEYIKTQVNSFKKLL